MTAVKERHMELRLAEIEEEIFGPQDSELDEDPDA